ncbi:uncharacterized protein LOC120347465 [Styela clava]
MATIVLQQLPCKDQVCQDQANAALILSGKNSVVDDDVDFMVGRHPDCELQLDTPILPGFLSRSHAKVTVSKGHKVYVTDLKSLNGTLVNNIMLEPMVKTELKIGDIVTFGCFSPDVVLTPGSTVIQNRAPFKFQLTSKDDLLLAKGIDNEPYTSTPCIPLHRTLVHKSMISLNSTIPHSSEHDHCETKSKVDAGLISDSTFHSSCDTTTTMQHDDTSKSYAKHRNGDFGKKCCLNNTHKDQLLPLTVSNLLAFSGCHFDNINFSSDEKENVEGETRGNGIAGNIKSNQPKVKMKRPTKRKRRSCFTKRKSSKNEFEDRCASFECKIKNTHSKSSKLVSWVQCDFCDKWYHTECVGCDYNTVKSKARKFQCGVC